MPERKRPVDTDPRGEALRDLVNTVMREHPDQVIQQSWRGIRFIDGVNKSFFVATTEAVRYGVAAALTGETIEALLQETREYANKKKLPKISEHKTIAQGLITKITGLGESYSTSLNALTQDDEIAKLLAASTPPTERAFLETRKKAAQYLTMLEYLCDPIPENTPEALKEKLKLVSLLSRDAVDLIQKKQKPEQRGSYALRATQPRAA